MSQLEYTSDTRQTEPGARREDYLRWRQRLAERQEDFRNFGEHDTEPTVSSEWSPEALFKTDGGSAAPVDVAPVDMAPVDVAPVDVAPADVAPATTQSPTSDAAWDRAEVEALLRQSRAAVGSPRTASRGVRGASGSGLAGDQSSVGRGPDPMQERRDRVARYFDGSRVVRTSTDERAHNAASIGDQLRELNRLRVEGELDDDGFNRRKRALFARRSTLPRSST